MKKMTTLLLALTMSAAVHAQEIEKIHQRDLHEQVQDHRWCALCRRL